MNVIFWLLLCVVTFFIRARILVKGDSFGCDAFYFLISVREYKKTGKIPYRLPYYFLDIEEQWYPPGFIVFLSIFPEQFLNKYHKYINPILDIFQLTLVYWLSYFATGNSVLSGFISGITYALIPNLNTENLSMNVRTLASLLSSATMLSIIGCKILCSGNGGGHFLIPVTLGFGFLLFMTHKMAVQNLVFILLVLSLIKMDIYYALVLVGIFTITFIFSGGHYLKMLKAHLDVLLFWMKNLKHLCAHQYKDSPIYGGNPDKSENRFHQEGIKGAMKHLKIILGFNPFVIFVLFYPFLKAQHNLFYDLIFWWAALTYVMVFATTFWGPLKFLGEGWKYIKFAALPVSFVTGVLAATNVRLQAVFVAVALLSLGITIRLQNKFRREHTMGGIDDELRGIFDYLKNLTGKGLVCIPTHLSNAAVFYTQKKVLWGGHSLVSSLEGFFPVVREPLENYVKRYGIKYVLIDDSYISPDFILREKNKYKILKDGGKYKVYEVVD